MSTLEENILGPQAAAVREPVRESIISRFLKLMCSVRLGVSLLCLLALACLIGMLVMQQNVQGFDNYYYALTPAQRLVYGKLGIFDIYHVWYFNVLLAVLSLNIILASIDRFPKTWIYKAKPQTTPPARWIADQPGASDLEIEGEIPELTKRAKTLLREHGWKTVRTGEKGGRQYVFGESGVWNRFGAYAVHVALLTIFTGGFLTAQYGTTGNLPLALNETSNLISETVVNLDKVNEVTKQLPFEVTFTDMQQKLIKDDGSLSAGNTIDWITRFTIKDETGSQDAMVQMNRPYDYRGYRFFQASFTPVGRARNIEIEATPAGASSGERLTIPRDGVATLADGTRVRFAEFRGNFRIGPEDPNEDTSTYQNPAAVLQATPPGGTMQTAYAFGPQMAQMPVANKPVAGHTFKLLNFEKVADRHILSVQRDPGANVVYVGFVMLFLTLVAVFFFSHQRVWVMLKESDGGKVDVTVAGNANRNQNALAERCRNFVEAFRSAQKESKAI